MGLGTAPAGLGTLQSPNGAGLGQQRLSLCPGREDGGLKEDGRRMQGDSQGCLTHRGFPGARQGWARAQGWTRISFQLPRAQEQEQPPCPGAGSAHRCPAGKGCHLPHGICDIGAVFALGFHSGAGSLQSLGAGSCSALLASPSASTHP